MTESWTPPAILTEAIAAGRWRTTRPSFMPEHPHEYITRHSEPELFALLKAAIAAHGYWAEVNGAHYRYLNLDGYKYWAFTIILNRERLPEEAQP